MSAGGGGAAALLTRGLTRYVDHGPEPAQVPADAPVARTGRTLRLHHASITGAFAIAGPAEGRGPLGQAFDEVTDGHLLSQPTWEQAESLMMQRAVQRLCRMQGRQPREFDLLLAGDLLNQNISSGFAAAALDVPYLGLYNACATFAQGLGLAATLCASGACERAIVAVSSHHDAAERQYRFPTELGNQRPPSAQWTATGAVAVSIARDGGRGLPRITAFTPGRVMDFGVKDPLQMGAAMAPAAADTLAAHLRDLGRAPDRYDALYTGDLGSVGLRICAQLLDGLGAHTALRDCGVELYDPRQQDVHAGGSGTACSALVFAARLLPALREGRWRRACLCGTGCLHSVATYQQGCAIPTIAHAVTIEGAAD